MTQNWAFTFVKISSNASIQSALLYKDGRIGMGQSKFVWRPLSKQASSFQSSHYVLFEKDGQQIH